MSTKDPTAAERQRRFRERRDAEAAKDHRVLAEIERLLAERKK